MVCWDRRRVLNGYAPGLLLSPPASAARRRRPVARMAVIRLPNGRRQGHRRLAPRARPSTSIRSGVARRDQWCQGTDGERSPGNCSYFYSIACVPPRGPHGSPWQRRRHLTRGVPQRRAPAAHPPPDVDTNHARTLGAQHPRQIAQRRDVMAAGGRGGNGSLLGRVVAADVFNGEPCRGRIEGLPTVSAWSARSPSCSAGAEDQRCRQPLTTPAG